MAVALVVNGIPDLQPSMAEGLASLRLLLQDRRTSGCTVSPVDEAAFGIQYRILHPGAGIELVYLTDYPDPDNQDWDTGG